MTWEQWVQLARHWREQGDALRFLMAPVLIVVGLALLAACWWHDRYRPHRR